MKKILLFVLTALTLVWGTLVPAQAEDMGLCKTVVLKPFPDADYQLITVRRPIGIYKRGPAVWISVEIAVRDVHTRTTKDVLKAFTCRLG